MQKGIAKNRLTKFIKTPKSKIRLTESGIIVETLLNKDKI